MTRRNDPHEHRQRVMTPAAIRYRKWYEKHKGTSMRELHMTTLELLAWLSNNGPALQHEMVAAGFTRVSAKVNYLREEDLIVGTPTGKRGYAYDLTAAGRRKVAVITQKGEIVPPRSIAFSGTYSGPNWLPVRHGGMDAFGLANVET